MGTQDIIKIPPMEYFSLSRAANILQCDEDDLLHYGVIGAIPLCIMMKGFSSALVFLGAENIKDPIGFYYDNIGASSFLFRENNYLSYFNSTLSEYDVYKNDAGFLFYKGMAHGLWCVGHGEIENILYSREARITSSTFFRPFGYDEFYEKTGLSCHIVSSNYFNRSWLPSLNRELSNNLQYNLIINQMPDIYIAITRGDLFISRDSVLKIKEAIESDIPMKSIINGGVADLQLEDDSEMKKVHGNAYRHSENRENSIMALYYIKINYPDECKNDKGIETNDAWATATLNHWCFIGAGYSEPSQEHLKRIISDMTRLPKDRTTAGRPKKV